MLRVRIVLITRAPMLQEFVTRMEYTIFTVQLSTCPEFFWRCIRCPVLGHAYYDVHQLNSFVLCRREAGGVSKERRVSADVSGTVDRPRRDPVE